MTVTAVPARRGEVPAPAAITALARVEARHLLRGPFFLGGLLLSVALVVAWSWTRMPTWDTYSQNAGMSSLVLAAALLIAAHLATGRDHRAGAGESARAMPTGRPRRGAAMLVVLPIAVLSGAVLYLSPLPALMPSWPVGRFDPWAAAVVLVIPPIGAALGVLAGRLMPGVAAGPLSVVALVVVLIALLALTSSADSYAAAVWPVPDQPWEIGAARPTGWHLSYLLGVLIAITAVVVRPAWRKASVAILIGAVALSGLAVQRQSAAAVTEVSYPADAEPLTGVDALRCQTHREVRYCALPHHEPWIALWRGAVEPVAGHLPPGAARPTVRQIGNSYDLRPLLPGRTEIIVATSWGRTGSWAEDSRTRMAADYVSASVGIQRAALDHNGCEGAGQHRTVAALWLLAQALPDDAARVRSGDLRPARIRYGAAELQAAATLLDRPYEEVAGHLSAHWAELLDPSATALAGLGVTLTPPPIPAPEPAGPAAEGGVCR